jgi:8-amino-7-oxononanoate synthase
MSLLAQHQGLLSALADRGRLRARQPVAGIDFASNDYLGLAGSALLRDIASAALARGVAPGSGAARLLRGNDAEFSALESEAALHFGSGAALYLANGYVANLAIFSALPQARDLVVHDALIHASAIDGLRLSAAEAHAFAHNDVQAAADRIADWRAAGGRGHVWIAIESLYSMQGDLSPLADFHALAVANDAFLIVDEAHATGIWGPGGRGLGAPWAGQDRVVTLHTCGKALGASGALICAAPTLCEVLVNRARGFVYSTAPSPLMAALVRGVLAHLGQDDRRRLALQARVARAGKRAAHHGFTPSGTQILPVLVGQDHRTMALAGHLQGLGFDIRGIRAPTVPKGTERLRLSLTLNPDDSQIDDMFAALAVALTKEHLP